jgi:diguanylate cyclase (GGDEF)-like protein/PAS domain S-box-containing protein
MTAAPATILIVDDEIRNCRLLEALLHPEGYLTLVAANGEEALAAVALHAPDLVLLDIMMPGMDGYQVASSLKANPATANIPVIMVTAQSDRDTRLAGLNAGAEEFLTKPVDRAELWIRVRNLLRLKAYSDLLQNHNVILEQQVHARTIDLQRFRTAMDATADAIVLVNRSTMRYVEFNARACAILGYTREEMFELGPVAVVGQERIMLERIYDAVIAAGGATLSAEGLLRRKDGSQLQVEVRRHAQRAGADWIIVGVVRDITERKQAEQRLRELAAQRDSEAARQAGILAALPANIALLDIHGTIITVNQAWERFGSANAQHRPGYAIGVNYLEICDQARGDDASEARQVAAGIRSVLVGEAQRFSIEYSCHSSTEQRWFLMTVNPLAGDPPNGAVVAHFDITARVQAEQGLRESDRRFSGLLQNIQLASVMLDRQARITYCNDYLLRLSGWRLEEIIGRNWIELFRPASEGDRKDFFIKLLADQPEAWHGDNQIFTRSGERRLMRWNNSVLRSAAGEVIGTASIGEDITERKKAEDRIVHLNRVHAVLSGINSLIVRVLDREELFREACRIAVEDGLLSLAWLGIVDRRAMELKVVASHDTTEGYVKLMSLGLSQSAPGGLGMAGRAVFERKAVIANDIETDSGFPLKKEALARGFRSMVVLPLMDTAGVIGVLALYADTIDFFDQEEMKLLLELAGDISFAIDHLEKTERIDYLARYDTLTGLANRSLFQQRVAQYIEAAAAQDHRLAVLVIDIERFKLVNETLGRSAGDLLLLQVAGRLVSKPVNQDLFARVGPDQFAMVLPAMQSAQGLARRIERLLEEHFGPRFTVGDAELKIAVRAGVALYPNDGGDAETLLANADAALKKAKAGGEQFLFYTHQMTEQATGRLNLENQLRRALEREEFVLYYQPKLNLATRRIDGVEALIRWNSTDQGLVPPMQFIPLMEQTGLILEVGAWALRRAVLDYQTMVQLGTPLRVAVNVSPLQLKRRNFVDMITQAIRGGATPTGIDLEITEGVMMEDIEGNIAKLKAVRALGLNIAIDDFGTGYSSLGYLARLPVDSLKIDRSFIISMLEEANTMTLVSTIISLAHSLNLKVIAEGVDAREQQTMLALLRCDQIQGYLICHPLPLLEMLTFAKKWASDAQPRPQ